MKKVAESCREFCELMIELPPPSPLPLSPRTWGEKGEGGGWFELKWVEMIECCIVPSRIILQASTQNEVRKSYGGAGAGRGAPL